MKVLFAVNNDSISDAIIKEYQKEYKEIISYKNVYYFNAILKELQNDKSYDRVVISEDLEPFANNNYDTIDKFLFEKLDKISDEATKANGENIEIILVCADRRNKSDEMLTKIFGIGIYNALIGDERNIDNLCKLMNQPRNKKEAKLAYKIDGNNIGYQAEDENNVSESEVQNILAHYKRLGKDEDKYVDSFNNIVSQYTDAQLRIIIRYLPINVKAVLEERSPKYQELSTFSSNRRNMPSNSEKYIPKTAKSIKEESKINVKMLKNEKEKITKPIVIPSALNNKKTVKIEQEKVGPDPIQKQEDGNNLLDELNTEIQENDKKRRGRPRKNPIPEEAENKPKRGRGRPKKTDVYEEEKEDTSEEEDLDLFNIGQEEENYKEEVVDTEPDLDLFSMSEENEEESDSDIDLFNMDLPNDSKPENEIIEDEEEVDLFNMDEIQDYRPQISQEKQEEIQPNKIIESNYRPESSLNTILTSKKKIVAFVGTTKNGTSFIVNNLAMVLSSMNISTAILDTTQSKNAYYIYTKNEEQLRNIAEQSINKLENGVTGGIKVNKNLTVYTELPGNEQPKRNVENILVTLMQEHDVVLIDADFNTDTEYFEKAQEIYLVQSMDILTIQPLTAFLRNLKTKNILRQEKLKIIINKWQKIGGLTDKVLIGGMSSYNDPSMSFMTELFNKDNIKYCKIPLELQNYGKYIEALVNCEISLKGYTKQLLMALNELSQMVYPMLNQEKYSPLKGAKKNKMQFSDETKNTLDRMKRNY